MPSHLMDKLTRPHCSLVDGRHDLVSSKMRGREFETERQISTESHCQQTRLSVVVGRFLAQLQSWVFARSLRPQMKSRCARAASADSRAGKGMISFLTPSLVELWEALSLTAQKPNFAAKKTEQRRQRSLAEFATAKPWSASSAG